MYEIGSAKTDITCFIPDVGMMGYGIYDNRVEEIETPLHARAFVIHDPDNDTTLAFVSAEICFISPAIKRGVIEQLVQKHPQIPLSDESVMLTAQHTHSGPGGYNHYPLYNFTVPGFMPEIFNGIVDGITKAIALAYESRTAATAGLNRGEFAVDIDVACNRSVHAYLSNPETESLHSPDKHLAVDRHMDLMRFDETGGGSIGAISWFGVHPTNLGNDNRSICGDNKGFAANFMEATINNSPSATDFVAAFAQASVGDISPRTHPGETRRLWSGRFSDEIESAKYNGQLQFEKAYELFESMHSGTEIHGDLDYGLAYVDFSDVTADPKFTGGKENCRTGSACLGAAFFGGTTDGPGMPPLVRLFVVGICRVLYGWDLLRSRFVSAKKRQDILRKYRVHGNKIIVSESGERRFLGSRRLAVTLLPRFLDRGFAEVKRQLKLGALEEHTWTPHVLPVQILIIGQVALIGIPGETTTIAGQRIRESVLTTLKTRGIEMVIACPYANAYCGYLTTHQEYQHQAYEGGHTVFGTWTLAAFQTKICQLATELTKPSEQREISSIPEPIFSERELSLRTGTAGRQDTANNNATDDH